jgi:hypothetical protein
MLNSKHTPTPPSLSAHACMLVFVCLLLVSAFYPVLLNVLANMEQFYVESLWHLTVDLLTVDVISF